VTNRALRYLIPLIAAGLGLSLLQTGLHGQTTPTKPAPASTSVAAEKNPFAPPRTSDGQPDIRGFWGEHKGGVMGLYSIEDGASEEHSKITNTTATKGPSMVIDPPDGKIPYQPWAAAIRREIHDNYQNPKAAYQIDPVVRCFLEGTRNFYQSVFQIQQTPGNIVFLFEFQHAYRVIPLDGRPHAPENVKLYMGDSRGHWEGNTLVVDVTNNNDQTWFDLVGSFHSDKMHIVERYTPLSANTMRYEATFTDPEVFTRPWTMAVNFDRTTTPNFELLEDACHEGERDAANELK
jgi:hypothetical protein